jgi:hypothetical protein
MIAILGAPDIELNAVGFVTFCNLVRNLRTKLERRIMAKLAQVGVAAAPACPKCRNRITNLPLDELSGGDEIQCIFCSEVFRIPQQVLDRLIEQRDAFRREHASQRSGFFQRIADFFRRIFGG